MGACLSCLGARKDSNDSERSRLLYSDDAFPGHYGSWGQSAVVPAQNVLSAAEVRREQEALDGITRWASDQIVEIFPHQADPMTASISHGLSDQTEIGQHHDIMLAMIPGDKSKRSIRIYPASRPSSKDASVRGKSSILGSKVNGSTRSHASGVFMKLDVDVP